MNNYYDLANTIISFLGFVVLCVEIGLMFKDQKNHMNEVKIQEAIQLSDKFKNLISCNISFINNIFIGSDYEKALKEVPDSELQYFDLDEFNDMCLKHSKMEKYRELKQYVLNENFNRVSSSYVACSSLNAEEYSNIKEYDGINWELEKIEDKHKKINMSYYKNRIMQKLSDSITDTLNELEELCMALNKGIVDEETVYQSLHQIVIITIKYLYPVICKANAANNSYDKYYTHTITLYKNWTKKRDEAKNKEKSSKDITHKYAI